MYTYVELLFGTLKTKTQLYVSHISVIEKKERKDLKTHRCGFLFHIKMNTEQDQIQAFNILIWLNSFTMD